MKRQFLILFLLLAAGWVGCGKDLTAQRIAGLRAAGEIDSAYAEAVRALEDDARREAVWREFVRACLELTRREISGNDAPTLVYLTQAGIVCAAMRENIRKPSGEWREVMQLTAHECERQLNAMLGEFNRQQRMGQQAIPLRKLPQSDRAGALRLRDLDEQIAEFRREAAGLIRRRATLQALYERLPESSGGTKSSLREQLRVAQEQWLRMLELEEESDAPIAASATEMVERTLEQAKADFREVGYLLPNTVIENGANE